MSWAIAEKYIQCCDFPRISPDEMARLRPQTWLTKPRPLWKPEQTALSSTGQTGSWHSVYGMLSGTLREALGEHLTALHTVSGQPRGQNADKASRSVTSKQ